MRKDFPPAFRKADVLVLTAIISATLLCWYKFASNTSPPGEIEIRTADGKVEVLAVPAKGEKRVVKVAGPMGESVIELTNEGATFKSSPCPNKICILGGTLKNPGQSCACVPNRVIIMIRGKSQLDGVTQ